MSTDQLVTFTLGFVIGGVVFWNVSMMFERFRRARRDLRAARRGLRTLIEMVIRRAEQALGWLIIGVISVGTVFLFWHRR